MAIDTKTPISRRGLLAAVAGAVGAAAVGTVAKVERAVAAGSDGETIVVGGTYPDARSVTALRRSEADPEGPLLALSELSDDLIVSKTMLLGGDGVTLLSSSALGGDPGAAQLHPGYLKVEKRERTGPNHKTEIRAGNVTTERLEADGKGVVGRGFVGVYGTGKGKSGKGVRGSGLRGGYFEGEKAQIRLKPGKRDKPPARGNRGDLYADKKGRLWFCKGDRNWKQIA